MYFCIQLHFPPCILLIFYCFPGITFYSFSMLCYCDSVLYLSVLSADSGEWIFAYSSESKEGKVSNTISMFVYKCTSLHASYSSYIASPGITLYCLQSQDRHFSCKVSNKVTTMDPTRPSLLKKRRRKGGALGWHTSGRTKKRQGTRTLVATFPATREPAIPTPAIDPSSGGNATRETVK